MKNISIKSYVFFIVIICFTMIMYPSCKQNDSVVIEKPVVKDTPFKEPVDPEIAQTIGFFLNDWQPKTYLAPVFTETTITSSAATTTITVDASTVLTKIPLTIFGHNANNWMTKMYNEPIFINHLTNLKPNIIRWPAGSGSDCHFWNCNQDMPPADAPTRLKKSDGTYQTSGLYTYGKTANSWQANLDDYYSVLKQTNSQGLITVNYGYARYGTSVNPVATAAHLAADWVRYDNGRTKYWEVGNECYAEWEWGYRIDINANKDGQPDYLTGGLYAKHFIIFADSMKKAAAEIGKTIYVGAVMQESATSSWQATITKTWNATMIPQANNVPDFYIGHNYITPYNENSTAATVLNSASTVPTIMMNFMKNEITINGGIQKPIAFTEWNMWAQDSKQQVSNTSGTFAVIVQGEALKNNFGLSTRWDLYNGWSSGNDHGLFSTGDALEGVAKWTPRPSFYYMYYFQKCIGDRLVGTATSGDPSVKAYASTYTTGQASVALLNTSGTPQTVQVKFNNFHLGNRFYWYSLEGSNDNGDFSRKVIVNGSGSTAIAGGPSDYATLKARSTSTANGIRVIVPAWSAVFLMVDKL